MFYLLLELPALRQLAVTRGAWARGIEESLSSLLSRHEARRVEEVDEYRLYLLLPASRQSIQELRRLLDELQEILDGVKEDLMGYAMVLHLQTGGTPREILQRLKASVLSVASDDGLWITPEAAEAMGGVYDYQEEPGTTLLRACRDAAPTGGGGGLSLADELYNLDATDPLISFLESDPDQQGRRTLLLNDGTDGLLRWVVAAILGRERRAWLEIEAGALRPGRLGADTAPSIDARALSTEGEAELRRFEREVAGFVYADRYRSYPDNPEAEKFDLWHEAFLLLRNLHPEPIAICFDGDQWNPEEVERLRELLDETDGAGEITVLFVSPRETALLSSFSEQVEVLTWEPDGVGSYDAYLTARRRPRNPEKGEIEPEGPELLVGMDERDLLLLTLVEERGAYLSPRRLEILAERLAISTVEYRRRIEGLLDDGLLWNRPDGTLLLPPPLRGAPSGRLDLGSKNRLTRLVGIELLHLYDRGELEQRRELFPALIFAAGEQQQERLFRDYLWERLPEQDEDALAQLLFGFPALQRDRLERLARIFRWRIGLFEEGSPGALPLREQGVGGFVEAEYTLALAEAHYVEGLLEKSLYTTKRAVALFSRLRDEHGLSRSYLQLALVSLGRGEINDGAAYLNYAVESGRSSNRGDLELVGELLRQVVSFVWGNLSRVVQEAPELSTRANRFRRSGLELFAHFLYGRALTELGRFEEAERAFTAIYRRALSLGNDEAAATARRWGSRAYRFSLELQRKPLMDLEEGDGSREEALFALERSFLTGEESYLLEAEQEPREPERNGGFHPLYRISWTNGFAAFEDLVLLSRHSTLDNLLYALTAWFRGRRGNLELARQRLRRLTREERLSPADPWKRLYFYLYGDVLPREATAETEDRRTVLAKSIKLTHERSARLDRTADKERYLMANPWNQLLIKEGKQINML